MASRAASVPDDMAPALVGRSLLVVALLAAWLGAAALVAGAVAPAAFAVLPSRALAGALVGRVLPVIFLAGVALGAVAGYLSFAAGARAAGSAALVVAVACAVAQFAVGARIAR